MEQEAFVFDYEEWKQEAEDNDELDFLLNEVGLTQNPADYYFNMHTDPSFQQPFAVITPKKFFDANGYQYDGHVTQEAGGLLALHPEYSEETEGSIAAWDENLTQAQMRADLLARGFIENLKV